MAAKEVPINKGPSVGTLVDAFKYAYGGLLNIDMIPEVEFVTHREALLVQITMLQHEDRSGQSFNFSGYLRQRGLIGFRPQPLPEQVKVTGYYNAQTRRGHIKFVG